MIFAWLGLVHAASTERAIIAETIASPFGGIPGTRHHNGPAHRPLSSPFGAVWPIMFFVAVGLWNTVGADRCPPHPSTRAALQGASAVRRGALQALHPGYLVADPDQRPTIADIAQAFDASEDHLMRSCTFAAREAACSMCAAWAGLELAHAPRPSECRDPRDCEDQVTAACFDRDASRCVITGSAAQAGPGGSDRQLLPRPGWLHAGDIRATAASLRGSCCGRRLERAVKGTAYKRRRALAANA